MFELSRLNVHRIVATKEEKAKLIAIGYKEVTREEFLKEITEDKDPSDAKPVIDKDVPAVTPAVDAGPQVDSKPVKEVKKSKG